MTQPYSTPLMVVTPTRLVAGRLANEADDFVAGTLADEADDFLGLGEDRVGDLVGSGCAILEDAVDMVWVGEKLAHLGSDRGQLRRGELGERILELGELRSAELTQDLLLGCLGERRIDADQ